MYKIEPFRVGIGVKKHLAQSLVVTEGTQGKYFLQNYEPADI